MTPPTIQDYLKYANLQTAAEAFLVDNYGIPLADDQLIEALKNGNFHTSKFTGSQATAFADLVEGWTVLDQCPNTTTGFSGTLFRNNKTGELVMSFRSTEFIDDALRDSLATNIFEIKGAGFAWGQIADMEKWYAGLQADPAKIGGKAFSVTGYSLGGNIATAFNLLHPNDAQQVVTFNGAGVGEVIQGTLKEALDYFSSLRNEPTQIEALLTDPGLLDLYKTIRGNLISATLANKSAAEKVSLITFSKIAVTELYHNGPMPSRALDIWRSLDDIETMVREADRIANFKAGGGENAGLGLVSWDPMFIEAENLDYRMAVRLTAPRTLSASNAAGGIQGFTGKKYLPEYANTRIGNQWDVVGDTLPSVVSNSQWHIGEDVKIFIEDQPLYRGGVGAAALSASWDYKDPKLLVDNYAVTDFGDTHSIVLLVDQVVVKVVPDYSALNALRSPNRYVTFGKNGSSDNTDTLTGSDNIDRLYGGAGNDKLYGDADNVALADQGDDTLFGGAGDDTYLLNLGDGHDTLSDAEGINTIVFGPDIDIGAIGLAGAANGETFVLHYSDADSITIEGLSAVHFKYQFSDGSTFSGPVKNNQSAINDSTWRQAA